MRWSAGVPGVHGYDQGHRALDWLDLEKLIHDGKLTIPHDVLVPAGAG